MEFVLVFAFAVGFIWFVNSMNKQVAAQQKEVIQEIKKVCPPHKWFHQEVKDQEGKTHAWRLVCELCGPLKPSDGPARME